MNLLLEPSNRGSGMRISTITLLGSKNHDKSNTYILGVGKKEDEHKSKHKSGVSENRNVRFA